MSPTADDVARIRRQLRVIAILDGAERAGLVPLPAAQLHAIAYFSDALAPVWGLATLDGELLKGRDGPFFPTLQDDLDLLVGHGVVLVDSVEHEQDKDRRWRLAAEYRLHASFAQPILEAAESFAELAAQLEFVRELLHALSGLGMLGIESATAADAAYGDAVVDFGDVLDLGGSDGAESLNRTARVALRFGTVMSASTDVELSPPEMVHLYVRELYKRRSDAA